MDDITKGLVEHVASLGSGDLTASARQATTHRIVDALGCALGALDSPPAVIARRLAGRVHGEPAASVLGASATSTVEMAIFANTAMVRHLDFNDAFISAVGGGGHPSDVIPTSLAFGEALDRSGEEVYLSIVVAYDVTAMLATQVRTRQLGWDQATFTVVSAAMAAGKLLRLTEEQLGHAVAMAITPHVATRQTRAGQLSMWKGCATASACRDGAFAAILASEGMTGPPKPFQGRHGICEQVTGPFSLAARRPSDPFGVELTDIKIFPSDYNSQGPIQLIVGMRDRVRAEDVESIEIETYHLNESEIGGEPEKWAPTTRETADHSLPYLISVGLLDGTVTPASFEPERMADPAVRDLMRRITVRGTDELEARFPEELVTTAAIRLQNGQTVTGTIENPRGRASQPLDDSEIDAKFDVLVAGLEDRSIAERIRALAWDLEGLARIRELTSVFSELPGRSH